jgi:hypothetical protein
VAIGDLNGDVTLDLAVANSKSDSASVLLNTTGPGAAAPSFAAKHDFATETAPASVALADCNGDGNLDLALANFHSNEVSVLMNTSAPSITITRVVAVGTILDDDSPASIVVASGDDQSVILGATFAAPLAVSVFNANGHLVQGVSVTFTAPDAGASGTFTGGQASVTSFTDANGLVVAPDLTSSSTAGSYAITAQAGSSGPGVEFQLSNVYGVDTLSGSTQVKKSGSTVVLTLEITDSAGDDLGSTDVPVQALYVVDLYGNQVPLQWPGKADPDGLLQYDPDTGIYQFNLKTTGYAAGKYTLYFQVGNYPTLYSLSFTVT